MNSIFTPFPDILWVRKEIKLGYSCSLCKILHSWYRQSSFLHSATPRARDGLSVSLVQDFAEKTLVPKLDSYIQASFQWFTVWYWISCTFLLIVKWSNIMNHIGLFNDGVQRSNILVKLPQVRLLCTCTCVCLESDISMSAAGFTIYTPGIGTLFYIVLTPLGRIQYLRTRYASLLGGQRWHDMKGVFDTSDIWPTVWLLSCFHILLLTNSHNSSSCIDISMHVMKSLS